MIIMLFCSLAIVFSCSWVLGAWIAFHFFISSLLPISHRHTSRTYQKIRVRETCLACAANDEICDDPMVIWGPYSAIKSQESFTCQRATFFALAAASIKQICTSWPLLFCSSWSCRFFKSWTAMLVWDPKREKVYLSFVTLLKNKL